MANGTIKPEEIKQKQFPKRNFVTEFFSRDKPTNTKQKKPLGRNVIWKFFNSKVYFYSIIIVLILISGLGQLLLQWSYPNSSLVGTLKDLTFFGGILQSTLATLLIIWATYIWRVNIRRFFQPQITYIRAPCKLVLLL